jgi:hypothetical protein
MEDKPREKITQHCPDCNSIVEAEILFEYVHSVKTIDELQCEGTLVKLAKCINCERPILLSEDFIEIEDQSYPHGKIQLYPDNESTFIANAPLKILNPLREAVKCFKATSYQACVIMCRKGVEAICQDKGESKGNLDTKLKNLKDKGILENTFYKWSNELREFGNTGAHSHESEISKQDAKDTIEFFEALILFLYHLVDKYDKLLERKNEES